MNRWFYLIALLYSLIAIVVFMKIKRDSIAAQLLIYLSMSVLFLFAAFISQNNPEQNATTFIVLLVVTPMFMIEKPYFMTIELSVATAVFLIWMRGIKPYAVWQIDMVNSVTFTVVGSFLNIISNALRIREFVLTRQIRLQKDTDEMTGLRNKGCLTREINGYLADASTDKGTLFIMDVDRFKVINDTFGHDVGDSVIVQLGGFLAERFKGDEITGRFGGDEFILFIKDIDDPDKARKTADGIVAGVAESVKLPDKDQKLSISIGVALYKGREKHYSELFKKADIALYDAKASSTDRSCVYCERG